MSMLFQIDGEDFTDCLTKDGLSWDRNDLDAPGAGRNLTGLMNRKRVTAKRTLTITMGIVTGNRMQALANALDKQYVSVTFDDPQYGVITKTFYSSKVSAAKLCEQRGMAWYKDGAFQLIER